MCSSQNLQSCEKSDSRKTEANHRFWGRYLTSVHFWRIVTSPLAATILLTIEIAVNFLGRLLYFFRAG